MRVKGNFPNVCVTLVVVTFICSISCAGPGTKGVSQTKSKESTKRTLNEETSTPVRRLPVTCTDCKDKVIKSEKEQHKIRHSQRKQTKHARNFNKDVLQTAAPSLSDASNSDPAETPLKILLRMLVNGTQVGQWLTGSGDFTKHSDNVKSSNPSDKNYEIRINNKNKAELAESDSSSVKKLVLNDNTDKRNPETRLSAEIFIDDDPNTLAALESTKQHHHRKTDKTDHRQNNQKIKSQKHKKKPKHHEHSNKNQQHQNRKLKGKKTSLKHILKETQNQDPYRRRGYEDQKLYNRLEVPVKSLLNSMDLVLDATVTRSKEVKSSNDFIYNSTRYTLMMGVRDLLQNIIKYNDEVYGAVVGLSELTRDVYRRSHKRQRNVTPFEPLIQDYKSTNNVGVKYRELAQDYRKYQQQYNTVKMMKMKSDQVAERLKQIKERLDTNLGGVELMDLIYHANQTTMKLDAEFKQSMAVRKFDRYLNAITDVRLITEDSRVLLRKARDEIRTATTHTRGNMIASQDRRRPKRQPVNGVDGGDLPPISYRTSRSVSSSSSSLYTPEEKARLQTLIRKASAHAELLRKTAQDSKRLLDPLIEMSRNRENLSSGSRSNTESITRKIIYTVKEMYPKLKNLGSLINFDEKLPVYCVFSQAADQECIGNQEESVDVGDKLGTCIEGSACDDTESSGADEDGSLPTTDMDFEFEEETRPSKDKQIEMASVFEKFGSQLSQDLKKEIQLSQTALNNARNVQLKVDAQSLKWNNTKDRIEQSTSSMKAFTDFKSRWLPEKARLKEISVKVQKAASMVEITFNKTQNRCLQATKKAEEIVSLVQGLQNKTSGAIEGSADDDDGGDDDGDGSVNEDIDMAATNSKVNSVKTELNTLKKLRVDTPVLCENVQDRIRKMRSDISALKEKVDQARLVLASLKLSVSVDDTSYIKSKVEGRSHYASIVTDIQVCIKPTSTDGIILVVDGNNSASYTLEMDNGMLRGVLKGLTRNEIAELTISEPLELDTWYTIRLKRVGPKLTMWLNTTDGENKNTLSFTAATDHHQPDPGTVYIGGAPANVISDSYFETDDFSWKGCISGLIVNGKTVPLFAKSHLGINPKPCDSNCHPSPKEQTSLRFAGDGYAEIPASLFYRNPTVTSVSIEFRTRQTNTFIMSIYHRRERFHLEVEIANGKVVIKTTTPTESTLLRSEKKFNDNKFHDLKISYRDSTTYPEVDDVDGLFSIERQPSLHMKKDGILLGGKQNKYDKREKSDKQPNLIGCLRNLRINNGVIDIFEMVSYENIHIGPCFTHNIWDNCVKFNAESNAVEFIDQKMVYLIDLTISRDSSGQLLHYTKGSDFNLLLSVKDGILLITETVKSLTAEINFPPNRTFIPLVVRDDNGKIEIVVLGEERSFSYGGWFYSNDPDTLYTIILGDASEDKFIGDIAELSINSELHDLSSRSNENLLLSCVREDTQPIVNNLILQPCR
ncbi:laminin subunit alpha [Patella vulgata]|uniref:laminin subunit alpha n=1 Tax=Patella vulgata TaxID=6465 RepID=UPI00218048C9|nr:laminin subunit alpha [Patella vulgata]